MMASSYSLSAQRQTFHTRYGQLAVWTSTPHDASTTASAPALLLIHGNSSSSLVFRHIFDSSLATKYKLIAFDLPGHGESSNADAEGIKDAVGVEEAYTMAGYAAAAVEVLKQLHVEEVVVFGWSLGGHAGIEMMALLPASKLKGLMITGTPPGPRGRPELVFRSDNEHMGHARTEHLTEEEVDDYARCTAGSPFESWMLENVTRTDGRARRIMFEAFSEGKGIDQKEVVESNQSVLLAVVNGKDEPFVDVKWVREEVKYGRLWKGHCVELDDRGHAPFWEDPDQFNEILHEFMQECSKL